MYQPCKTCPFREQPTEPGAPDWLTDLMKGLIRGSFDHSCHRTDPRADLFAGGSRKRKIRHCIGFLAMIKRSTGHCISPRAMRDIAAGTLEWAKIPTRGVFARAADAVKWHMNAIGIDLKKEDAKK